MKTPRESRDQMITSLRRLLSATLVLAVACWRHEEPPPTPLPPLPPLPALVSSSELNARLEIDRQVQIVDTRPDTDYASSRITGASTLPIELITIDPDAEFAAAARARLSALLSSAGLRKEGDIVAVDDATPAGFGRAALLCWAVALTRFDRCSVLIGGFPGWSTAGFAIDAGAERVRPARGTLDEILERPAPLASLSDLRAATAAPDPAVVDVRSLGDGPGIPGASRFPLASLWLPDGSIDRARLDSAATNSGLFSESALIVVGNGPADGAAGWFALTRVLALPDVRLYPAGLTGWRKHPELPGNEVSAATPVRP